jgi:hypothetical protein
MEKRTMLAAAGAVVLVVATGGVALGVNLGLMQATTGQDVGQLEVASASAELAPPVETIVIEEEVLVPAEPAPAPTPAPDPRSRPGPRAEARGGVHRRARGRGRPRRDRRDAGGRDRAGDRR